MSAKPFLYIWYADTDADFALHLAADLKNQGTRVFLDRLSVHPAKDRRQIAEQGLIRATGMIAILSPAFVASERCMTGLEQTVSAAKPVYPVLARAVPAERWPHPIPPETAIDFREREHYLKQRAALINRLRNEAADCFGAAPPPRVRYVNHLIARLERATIADLNPPLGDDVVWLDPNTWFLNQPYELLPAPSPIPRLLPPQPEQRSNFWQLVETHRQILLVGAPGSGKSTILRQLALHAAWSYLSAPDVARLPIFLNAADWPSGKDAPTFIRQQWTLDGDPIALLVQGGAVLFVDDLGSTPEGKTHARQFQAWLETESVEDVALVVTCNQADYEQGLPLKLPAARMVPPNANWFTELVTNSLSQTTAECVLAHIVPEKYRATALPRGLQQHLVHPYLLPLMGRICEEDGPIPQARYTLGKLLNRLVQELWERREPEADIPYSQLADGLSQLALASLNDSMPTYLPPQYAVQHLGNADLLQPNNSAGFLTVGETHVRFAHQLLLYYFAARGLTSQSRLEDHLLEPVFNAAEERVTRAIDPVLVVMASLSKKPDETVRLIAARDPFLAMECVYGGLGLSEETITYLSQQLMNSRYVQNGAGRVAAVRLLPASTHHTGIPILLEVMRTGSWEARSAATLTLTATDFAPLPELEETLRTPNPGPEAMRALRQWGEAALPSLLWMLTRSEQTLRLGAIRALGQLGDRAAVPALVDALRDESEAIRLAALEALKAIRDPEAYAPLAQMLVRTDKPVEQVAFRDALDAFGTDALHTLLDIARTSEESEDRNRLLAALRLIGPPYIQQQVALIVNSDVPTQAPQTAARRTEGNMLGRLFSRLERGLFGGSDTATTAPAVSDPREGTHDRSRNGEREAEPLATQPAHASPSAQAARERLMTITTSKGEQDESPPAAQPEGEAWAKRREEVLSMARKAPDEAIPRLTDALSDPDTLVRVAAVQTLSIFASDSRALEALYYALGDSDSTVYDTAGDVLKAVGRPAIPYLLRAIESDNVNVRGVAIETLGEIREPSVTEALADRLYDEERPWLSDKRICDLAAEALEKIGTRESLHLVLRWKAEKAPDPKSAALLNEASIQILTDEPAPMELQVDEALQQMLEDLHCEDWGIQQAAARKLREYAKKFREHDPSTEEFAAVTRQIVAAARAAPWAVRWAAAEALGWIASPSTAPVLIELLEDDNWIVRVAAIRSLVELADTEAVPYIAELLNDPKENVREAAAVAIGEIGGQSTLAINLLGKALDDSQAFVRVAAIKTLGKLKDVSHLDRLMEALQDPDVHIRWAAIEALEQIAAPETVPALIAALEDESGPYFEDRKICDVAAAALALIDTDEAQAALQAWNEYRDQDQAASTAG